MSAARPPGMRPTERMSLPADNLTSLAQTVRDEHGLVVVGLRQTLHHAIAAGEALIAARQQLKVGEWCQWVETEIEIARQTARNYVRIATYRDEVLALTGTPSIRDALTSLRELPPSASFGGWNRKGLTPAEIADVKAMRSEGTSWQSIADEMGIPRMRIQRVIDPSRIKRDAVTRNRSALRRTAERAALAARERDEAVRKLGGDASVAYALLRKAAQALDNAIAGCEPGEERQAMQSALTFCYKAEDEIVRALRLGRQLTPQQARHNRADRRQHQISESVAS